MASSLLICISVVLFSIFIIEPSHGLRVIRPQMSRIRRPQPSAHHRLLNPLTRTFVVDDQTGPASGFGHQFRRRSLRDDDGDDDLQADYFRFLLGYPEAVDRKRRSLPSGDRFVPDYDESMMQGDREWRTKRLHEVHAGETKPDYWDFINAGNDMRKKAEVAGNVLRKKAEVAGNVLRKKAEVAAEDRDNLDRKKTVVDGDGMHGSPVEEEDHLQQIRMHGFDRA